MANEFVAKNGLIAQNNSVVSGSLIVTNGITGSLFGTSSQAETASYAIGYALDSSVVHIAGTETITGQKTFTNLLYAQGYNRFDNGLTIANNTGTGLAGGYSAIVIGLGAVSHSLTLYDQSGGITSTINFTRTGSNSYNFPNTSGIVALTTSTVASASYAYTASSASNSFSASYAQTSSFANNFTVANQLTAQTLVVTTISSSVVYSSGSNIFGNNLSNTQVLTGSVGITGSLTLRGNQITSGSSIITGSLSITGSINSSQGFTGSLFGTASLATSASYAFTASSAINASASLIAISASYAFTASSAIRASASLVATSASYAYTASSAIVASASLIATSASYAYTASSAILASASLVAVSSSYAFTASSAINAFSASNALTASSVNILNQNVNVSGAISIYTPNGPNASIINTNTALILQGAAGGAQTSQAELRITANSGMWVDDVTASYFQIRTTGSSTNNNVVFTGGTYGADSAFDRLQFASNYTQITNVANASDTWAPTASFEVLNQTSGSTALMQLKTTVGQTANYLNVTSGSTTTPGNVFNITKDGVVAIGTTTTGTESNLYLGGLGADEGGQLTLQPGLSYTSGAMLDNWKDTFRVLRGNSTTSDNSIASWNLGSRQFNLAAYTNSGSFPGTATANLAVDSSGNVITIAAGTTTSASYAATASQAISASYAFTASSASTAFSASYAATSSFANNFTVANTLTAQTIVVSTISSSVVYSSGSNIFGNSLSNTQTFTGSLNITGGINLNSSKAIIGDDISYGAAYQTLAFGGATNGFNRISGHSGTLDGLYFMAATGRGFVFRPNGATIGKFIIASTGRVGIGDNLSSPNALLQVSGSGTDNLFQLSSTVSSSVFFVSGSGNIGMGTSTPYASAGYNTFTIDGGLGGQIAFRANGGNRGFIWSDTTNFNIGAGSGTNDILLKTGASLIERIRVSSNGTTTVTGSVVITGSLTLQGNQLISGSLVFTTGSSYTPSYDLEIARSAANGGTAYIYGNGSIWTFGSATSLSRGSTSNGNLFNILMNGTATTKQTVLRITGSWNQSGAGGYTVLELASIETTTGTGARLLQDWIVNGVSAASLDSAGRFTLTGSINASQGITGSLFGTASWAQNALTASYLLGYISPFPFTGSAQITGSLGVTGSFSINAASGSSALISNADTLVISGSLIITGSTAITGSMSVSDGISGSLFGTASQAVTASYALTASYVASIAGLSTSQIATGSVTASVGQSSSSFQLVSGSTTFLYVSNSGNLLIGTTTDAGQRLQVSGSSLFQNSLVGTIGTFRSATANGQRLDVNSTATGFRLQSGFDTGITGTFEILASGGNSSLILGTQATERMRIDNNGNVGINKSSPTARLDISGSTLITGSLNVSGAITTNGTITAQTLVVQTITSSITYSSGSNIFGNALTNTQTMTGSVNITGSLNLNGNQTVFGSITVQSASFDYGQNTNVVTGSFQVIASELTSSYRAAFFDYVMFSGSVVRAGTVTSTWSGGAVEFNESYTNDLSGSTAGVTLQAALSGGNIQLQATASSQAWTIRSLIRLL